MIRGITPRLSEGGKIKIGRKGEWARSGKFQLPQKLDHFLVTTMEREESGNFAINTEIMDALPQGADGKVREIPIVLHSDDIDEVFPTSYARYAGRTCACRGDGETATQWEVKEGRRTGATKSKDCPCDQREMDPPRCKPTGVLHCSIAIEGLAVAGSVYKWRTTSIISIQEMIGSLLHIKQTCGVFRGLPLTLCLKPVRVNPKGAPQSTVYTGYVELRAKDLQTVQQQALQMAQMRQALQCDDQRNLQAYRALLSDPSEDNETDVEQRDIADEFYPPVDAPGPLQDGTHKVSAPAKESEQTDVPDGDGAPATEASNPRDGDGWREAIARVQMAETVEAVHALTQDEKRKRVLAAAEARISELSKSPEEPCSCHEMPNPPVRMDGASRCHRCGLLYEDGEPAPAPSKTGQQDLTLPRGEVAQETLERELSEAADEATAQYTDEDETPFGFTDDEAGF